MRWYGISNQYWLLHQFRSKWYQEGKNGIGTSPWLLVFVFMPSHQKSFKQVRFLLLFFCNNFFSVFHGNRSKCVGGATWKVWGSPESCGRNWNPKVKAIVSNSCWDIWAWADWQSRAVSMDETDQTLSFSVSTFAHMLYVKKFAGVQSCKQPA